MLRCDYGTESIFFFFCIVGRRGLYEIKKQLRLRPIPKYEKKFEHFLCAKHTKVGRYHIVLRLNKEKLSTQIPSFANLAGVF